MSFLAGCTESSEHHSQIGYIWYHFPNTKYKNRFIYINKQKKRYCEVGEAITSSEPFNAFYILLYIELSNSFLIGWKRKVNFQNQRSWHHNCRLYNYHVKDTQGHRLSCHVWPQSMISKGNHVNFARFVLLAISEEPETWLASFSFNAK